MELKGFKKISESEYRGKTYKLYTKDSYKEYDKVIIITDDKDNILNIFNGINPNIYENILFLEPEPQRGRYINIETGEQLFEKYLYNIHYRCFTKFNFGYARVYNDKIHKYDVFNTNGDIVKTCAWFNMLNENIGFIVERDLDKNKYSLVDNFFNIIKQNCFKEIGSSNSKYIIASEETSKSKTLVYLFDLQGNKLSKGYVHLSTKDFKTFKTKEKGESYKKLNLDEILIATRE